MSAHFYWFSLDRRAIQRSSSRSASSRLWLASLFIGFVLAGCQTAPQVPPAVVNSPVVVEPTPKPAPRPPRIGLALGGGAARGFAHVGVIQVLEENGIRPDFVVGTSAGSLVATLYASGKTPTQLAALAEAM